MDRAFAKKHYGSVRAHSFYGYYTIYITEEGEIYGMLSVNGYDGAVWHHNWHGTHIQSREIHEE